MCDGTYSKRITSGRNLEAMQLEANRSVHSLLVDVCGFCLADMIRVSND
jgi:hypothetical protein